MAIGDVAFGVLFSVGGVAVGSVSIGGVSIGALSLGGVAVGLATIAGLAVGVLAAGGAALGWSGALGGLAVAHDFASGGVAMATHANDAEANGYFATHPFFRLASWTMGYSLVLVFIPAVMALVARLRAHRQSGRAI